MNLKRQVFCLAVLLALGLGTTLSTISGASAQSLSQYRASGAVGEGFDGYLYSRSRDGNVAKFVAGVNAQRRSVYTSRARSQGVSLDQVGRVYANSIMQKAPVGTWFKSPSGKWGKK